MKDKLPHHSTLAKFCERSAVLEVLEAMLQRLGPAGKLDTKIDTTQLA
jgi:hypothetical protein